MTSTRTLEWWISVVRLGAVVFAVFQVALTRGYPPGYQAAAWVLTALLAVGAVGLYATVDRAQSRWYPLIAMAFMPGRDSVTIAGDAAVETVA